LPPAISANSATFLVMIDGFVAIVYFKVLGVWFKVLDSKKISILVGYNL
jgi:hypothetical protein